jgi:hypothetical protein
MLTVNKDNIVQHQLISKMQDLLVPDIQVKTTKVQTDRINLVHRVKDQWGKVDRTVL